MYRIPVHITDKTSLKGQVVFEEAGPKSVFYTTQNKHKQHSVNYSSVAWPTYHKQNDSKGNSWFLKKWN